MAENNDLINIGCVVKCESKSSTESSCWKKEIYENSTARTSFFVFLYEYRQRLKLSCKKLRQPEICRRAGKKWRGMDDCAKQPYIIWARKNREKTRCASKPKSKGSVRKKRAARCPRKRSCA
uniref:HMG box domain-containing protein n=1 Tax=Glossina austeni TaxID=7395 RepID=A0A1A9UCW2_GLOAU